ncbi:MAG TPA: substrate-binding domain-containing protein [Clostridia bacterium]|nr:substrate-binding domain-containing protein [Syntrophomonas sp.]HWQ98669.1 substrate-binding domain-containing protein [Clostridia bacterium]
MKKLISLIMVLVTCVSFVACKAPAPTANSSAPEAATSAPETAVTASNLNIPSDLPKFKILVREMNFTNTLYAGWKKALESLQKQFNVEFVFVETGGSTDASKQALESALQTGINGSLDLGLTEQDVQIMLPSNCATVMYSSEPTDEATAAAMAGYTNYLGSIDEDNYGSGVKAAEALYQAGCKNIAIAGLTKGIAKLMDERLRGFMDGIAKHPEMKIIAEDYSMVEFAKAISTFAAAYPEMDGVYVSLINESVFQAFATEGLVGRVKLAGWDISDSTKDYIENGTLVYTGAGQEGSILAAFAVLYNYLYDGTYLIPDRAMTVPRAYIDILTADDYDNYMTYIVNSPAYTPDEVAGMIKAFNPSFTYEQFVDLNKNYSLDDIMQRHAGQ